MAKKPHHPKKGKPGKAKKGMSKKTKSGQRKKSAVDKQVKNPDAPMRLNKYIANSGICSRRDADIYIASGNVRVNGEVITEMGYKVKLTDDVRFDGRRINPEKKEYILLNKPAGFYVTGSMEKNNRTVMDLVSRATKSKVTPVGSFETSAMGLLFFTNDGTLKKKLARTDIRQIYEIELNRNLKPADLDQLREGLSLEDGFVSPKEVNYVDNKSKRHIGLELHSSKPRIVQRAFKKLGYEISSLDRVVYGGLTKRNLPRGRYRHLTPQEIINLGMA